MTGYRYRGTQEDLACGGRFGTLTGVQRHRRAGEAPCDDCRAAQNAYKRAWRAGRPKDERTATAHRLRQRALIQLKAMHPEDYRRLLDAEWIAETEKEVGA